MDHFRSFELFGIILDHTGSFGTIWDHLGLFQHFFGGKYSGILGTYCGMLGKYCGILVTYNVCLFLWWLREVMPRKKRLLLDIV